MRPAIDACIVRWSSSALTERKHQTAPGDCWQVSFTSAVPGHAIATKADRFPPVCGKTVGKLWGRWNDDHWSHQDLDVVSASDCVSLILVSIIFILSGFYFNPSLWQWDKCCSKIRVFFKRHVAGNSSCGTICSYTFFFFQNGYSSPVMRDNRICSGGRGGHWRGIWRRFRLHWSEWTQRLCSLLTYRGESYLCWNLVLWKSWILDLRMF